MGELRLQSPASRVPGGLVRGCGLNPTEFKTNPLSLRTFGTRRERPLRIDDFWTET